jgi:RNA polymerase sigma factor (TIGR02999 family)
MPQRDQDPAPAPLTELLQRAIAGDGPADDAALPLVYHELRRIAAARMANERGGHSLQATALVHEAWLRLAGNGQMPWSDRGAFYRAAAMAMRRILIDHARHQRRLKRGGGRSHVPMPLDELAMTPSLPEDAERLLLLDAELERLAIDDPRAATVVRLRFFAGLGIDDVAAMLNLSPRTVQREWEFARAHLYAALSEPDDDAA